VLADCAGDSLKLDLKSFLAQPEPVKVELVRRSLACIGSGEKDLTRQHYERILQIAQRNIANKKIELPDGFVARREYGSLIFGGVKTTLQPDKQINKSVEPRPSEGRGELGIPGWTKFGSYLIEATVLETDKADVERFKVEKNEFVEWFALEEVKQPLVVRFREAGDRFWPLGLGGQKKIGKFLTAARINHKLRKEVVIIADNDKIIWVGPVRASELTKITRTTKSILQIRLRRLR
jgi:tRNA(Ile)-lysidine synthase